MLRIIPKRPAATPTCQGWIPMGPVWLQECGTTRAMIRITEPGSRRCALGLLPSVLV